MLSLDVGCGHQKRADIGIDYTKDSDADIVADSGSLPFRDEVFGRIVSVASIEHSPNPLNFLKEQARVLKKGGVVEVVTDNAQYYNWSVISFRLRGTRHENECRDHYAIFFPENVMRLLALAGLKTVGFQYINRTEH